MEDGVVLARLPSGKYVGIKYNSKGDEVFANEFDRAEANEAEAKSIIALKNQIEDGTFNVHGDPNKFITNIKVNQVDFKQRNGLKLLELNRERYDWFRIESSLVEYDSRIKSSLGLDRADPKRALEYMNCMMQLKIDALMLKKHPQIIDMVKRLRKYIGNVKEWNLSKDKLASFEKEAKKVRLKAEEVSLKFKVN